MSDPGKQWLGKQVRVYSGVDRAKEYHPMVEGEVVAYIDGPSITVRASDGNETTWPVSLPIDAWEPPKPTDGEREWAHNVAVRVLNGVLNVSTVREVIAREMAAARAAGQALR